jgi:hypothetical protein
LIAFQADADLDHDIVVAVRQREPTIRFVPASEGGLIGLAIAVTFLASPRAGFVTA